jgi:hypothetical protein
MKWVFLLLVVIFVLYFFVFRNKEKYTLPDPVVPEPSAPRLNICPPGYIMSCVLKTLPGFQTPPPLPEKYHGICDDTHVAACLPSAENLMEPKML